MAGFGCGKRDPHRLVVAHLANDKDIRALAHGTSECRRKIRCVGANLDLLDETPVWCAIC
jgi:hypothetical protein